MAFTTNQITNLDNSMVAAQNVSLGTLVSTMQNNQVRSGSFQPSGSITDIATGLNSISGVVVSMVGTPTGSHMWTTATTGSIVGTIWVRCWKPTNATNLTPVTSTASTTLGFGIVSWLVSGSTT